MWLVRHLELIRLITLEDLRVAKTLCVPVFPPHYNILEHFMDLYHEALSNRLREIINLGLEGQEYVTVLNFIIQTYPGKDLMGSLNLNVNQNMVKPLLDAETIENLQVCTVYLLYILGLLPLVQSLSLDPKPAGRALPPKKI
jgi:exocyst complex component 3